ncbi:MAG: metallophosphoesterase [Sphingomonadales bacterium]|nr:metallophosphoesterase [Sphingomonadales bacterium]
MIFRRLKSRPSGGERALPCIPAGLRAYAIGDIHGRLDLLDRMLAAIHEDLAGREPAENHLLILGDLIDRGPDSRGVVERLSHYHCRNVRLVVLSGNHEEVLLRLLQGEFGLLDDWLTFGGAETVQSYGLDPDELHDIGGRAAIARIRGAIPEDHRHFLEAAVDTVKIGDYLFVHAGIRPAVHLSMQLQKDLRWIRQPFLDDDTDHGFVVVHGHTISREVVERPNRIGLDTGAYASGRLSALGLEAGERWFLEATQ